jgi:hypothetical protein
LKVISRDIAELVRQCLDDSRAQSGEAKKPQGSIIDTLLQHEIVKFTSVDFEDPGARPLSPEDLSSPGLSPGSGSGAGSAAGGDGDFIDPRAWATERLTPVIGIDQVEALERRDTISDAGSIASQAAQARQTGRGMKVVPPSSPAAGSSSAGDRGAPAGFTPGPEALASALEPALFADRSRSVAGRAKARRSFLIGAAIGLLLLGATMAAVVARKGGNHPEPPPSPSAQSAH